jgi:hypothetical protein
MSFEPPLSASPVRRDRKLRIAAEWRKSQIHFAEWYTERMSTKPYSLVLVFALVVNSCLEHKHKHIEPHRYQPEPHLTRDVLLSTFTGTGTLTVSDWITGSQFI